MMDPLRTPEDYELFLYSLPERYSSIRRSTLTFVRRGHSLARVSGEVDFDNGIRLVVLERLVFAPSMSFIRPNLPVLILEIEHLIREAP